MQSSLTSDNHLEPKFLARGASLLAHQLGHKNTNVLRASILALLEGRQSPLSPTQVSMVEDILTSPLGGRAISELNHVKYCDFDAKGEEHDEAVGHLLETAVEGYILDPRKTSRAIRLLLKEGENGPVPPETITSQKLWNNFIDKQTSTLHAHRLRQLLENVRLGKTHIVDTFFDGEALHFDPQNLLLGVVGSKENKILGNDIISGIRPTGEPGHLFSQRGERYVVCLDQQGRKAILNYSDANMFWGFSRHSNIPPKFLDVIPAENILETEELQTYTGEPLFYARVKKSYGSEYVLAHTLNRMPQIDLGGLMIMDIDEDRILIHSNNNSGSLAGQKIVSVMTGQELELRDSDAIIQVSHDDGVIQFNERSWLKFEGETPKGKEFSENVGGLFGKKEIRLSDLVKIWKKVALREAGMKV